MSVIDAYLIELDSSLNGPRRAKEDLLGEARDGLVDAAEAYQRRGLERDSAERRAVGEFGAVPQVRSDYQAELGLAQARRTALLVAAVLGTQHLAFFWLWRIAGRWAGDRPQSAPLYGLLAEMVDWAGSAAVAVAVLMAAACGIGVRHPPVARVLPRATGVFAFAVAGFFTFAGMALTVADGNVRVFLATTGLLWPVTVSVVASAWIALSARRCLAAG